MDEVAIQNLSSFKDKKFVDISKEDLDLGMHTKVSRFANLLVTIVCRDVPVLIVARFCSFVTICINHHVISTLNAIHDRYNLCSLLDKCLVLSLCSLYYFFKSGKAKLLS